MNKYDDYFAALDYVKQLSRVKNIVSEILSGDLGELCLNPDESMDISPWDVIAYSMLRNCELVKFDYDECPYCGKKRIQLYYQQPDNKQISGDILICPSCKRHFGLDEIKHLK